MPAMFSGLPHYLQRLGRYGWALLLSLMAVLAQAEIVDRLYEVSVPVQDQSIKERHQALMSALEQVLVKASGRNMTALRANGVVQAQRSKAEDYLLEYRYDTVRKEGAVDGASGIELTVRFAPEMIRKLLAQAGLALWPRARPTVMVWWQVEENGQRRMMGDALRVEAARRGLPVVLPMNDLQDKLAQEGLWQFDTDVIARVAERYGVSALLVGRAAGSLASGWRGQWLFYFQGRFVAIPASEVGLPPLWLEGQVLGDLELAGIEAVVAGLLDRYGIDLAGSTRRAELVVSGINSFEDYSQTLGYVQNLEAVRSTSLLRAEKQTLHYQLVFDGHLAVLRELLGLGVLLTEETPDASTFPLLETEAAPILRYRFSRR